MARKSRSASKSVSSSTAPKRVEPAPETPSSADTASSQASAQFAALTERAFDQLIELTHTFQSYIALERFVSPEYEDEAHAAVQPSRAELGALLHSLNEDIGRRLSALAESMAKLQAACARRPER